MVNYAVLPPEVNSARMYSGAGSSPMLTAAASWDRLAATLSSAASSYQAVVSQLTDGSWRGPSSAAMAASAQPYVQWMSTTAAQASQAAGQARAAASAYEAAFAATVPPPVVEANRAQLQVLLANNVIGQNAGAIAANQAEYGQMWAQDAAAMHGYAASSAATTGALNPFSPAPQTSKDAGQAQTSGNGSAFDSLINFLNNNPLASLLHSDPVTALETFMGAIGPEVQFVIQIVPLSAAVIMFSMEVGTTAAIFAGQTFVGVTGVVPALAAGLERAPDAPQYKLAGSVSPAGGAGVSAGMGRAAPVGGLSVPSAWREATPANVRLASRALPMSAASSEGATSPGFMGGMPLLAGMGNVGGSGGGGAGQGLRPPSSLEVIPRLARPGGMDGHTGEQSASLVPDAKELADVLSEEEQQELEELRKAVAELAGKRDTATRAVREAIR